MRRAGETLTLWQGRSRRKFSGGRIRSARNKRKYELGSEPTMTFLGKVKTKQYRKRGGEKKVKIMSTEIINVYDPTLKKVQKTKIITVKENTANPHYVQRNIMTKGAMVQTELGKVRITSRPGQDGALNGILEGKGE